MQFYAKYYNLILAAGCTPKGQLGIESVTKQYLYQLAYQQFIKDHGFSGIRNCFLLPTEKEEVLEIPKFNSQQRAAIMLIQNDLRYVYTILKNRKLFKSNYINSLIPYMGLIIDGVEDWINAYNNSSEARINIPVFNEETQRYYEEMRASIKMWDNSYSDIKGQLKVLYETSDQYFAGICKPVAKKLKLYDIFGADKVNNEYCGNTILCSYYIPDFKYGPNGNGNECIKHFSIIGGKYIASFRAADEYQIDDSMAFTCVDYGGFIKSPFGNVFSDKFVLFSMLCQIQFILYGVEKFIKEECSTKLRYAYLQYYYCAMILNQVNQEIGTTFKLNAKWINNRFRNAMAHYKVGVDLRPDEIIWEDPFYGMTQKYFDCTYFELKQPVLENLASLAKQIKIYLHLKNN